MLYKVCCGGNWKTDFVGPCLYILQTKKKNPYKLIAFSASLEGPQPPLVPQCQGE